MPSDIRAADTSLDRLAPVRADVADRGHAVGRRAADGGNGAGDYVQTAHAADRRTIDGVGTGGGGSAVRYEPLIDSLGLAELPGEQNAFMALEIAQMAYVLQSGEVVLARPVVIYMKTLAVPHVCASRPLDCNTVHKPSFVRPISKRYTRLSRADDAATDLIDSSTASNVNRWQHMADFCISWT